MRMSDQLMSDSAVQAAKIGGFAQRSCRSQWAESVEPLVRALSPFPITYDVSQTQGTGFSEYTYTEFSGGVWVMTQSLELNARLFHFVAQEPSHGGLDAFIESLSDKYQLAQDSEWIGRKKVVFMPGHNLMDVASVEMIARLVTEDEAVVIKPHPITNHETLRALARHVGWNKMVPKDVSGYALLQGCEVVYTTSASEMAITGTALGKRVVNVSNFFNEGAGTYHPISRLLFLAHQNHGVAAAQSVLANILHSRHSGLLFPFQSDIEERLEAYYSRSLELRERYKPLALSRGKIDVESRVVASHAE